MSKITDIQNILGVSADGVWGPESQAALDSAKTESFSGSILGWIVGKASSFADPADISAFDKCKAQGKTDQECFKVGDNGIGCWGDNTRQGSGPCCAIEGHRMVEKWGSRDGAKHKDVLVKINGISKTITVKDRLADNLKTGSVIDLNPDAVALFNLRPPVLVNAQWMWVDQE